MRRRVEQETEKLKQEQEEARHRAEVERVSSKTLNLLNRRYDTRYSTAYALSTNMITNHCIG